MDNSKIYVLWGVRVNDPDWMEEVIAEGSKENEVENVKTWALSNGFNRLRMAIYEIGDKPDFISAINI